MEVRAVSTAFSDFVLAGCSLYVAWMVYNSSVYASWGFMGIALAASFGVLKFGVVFPSFQPKVVRMHVISTWMASVLGIPLIAAGFCVYHHMPVTAKFYLVSSPVAMFLSIVHKPLEEKLTIIMSTLAVLGILFVASTSLNIYAMAGVLAYGFASAVKPTNFLGFPGIDWFHFILTGGNVLFMYGLIF
ncbi:uncharacterized protein [Montipora foliosa]|uniref:uncharacterized protein n=1 Tax=Montipora foliosa TaxID=591990 RepID=UPI0035F174CD